MYDATLFTPDNPKDGIDPAVYRDAYYRDFYYYPKMHKLDFYNYNGSLDTGDGVDLYFGTALEKYGNYATNTTIPQKYPVGLEPDAYQFAGWYYSSTFEEGTEVDWKNAKMPDADLTVYAKWVPNRYDITFYVTYTDAKGDVTSHKYVIKDVEHGKPMDTNQVLEATAEVKANPPVEGAQFAGWFYEDGTGKIVAFDPETMAVVDGMRLFAQWRTPTPIDYTVKYVYRDQDNANNLIPFRDANGEEIVTTGKAYLATTKTFQAKPFEGGYFPEFASQSIVISEDPEQNVIKFIYKKVDKMKYTVKCWDNTHKQWLTEGGTYETPNTTLDIPAPPIAGYLPTVAYERLTLSTDEAQNIVTFYYTENTTEAHYIVHHIQENVDGAYDYQYAVTDKIGTIDQSVSLVIQNQEGFTFIPGKTEMKKIGESNLYTEYEKNSESVTIPSLPREGLEIWLYYSRNTYSYWIQYLEYGTNEVLQDPKTESEKYGKSVKPYTNGTEDSLVTDRLIKDGITYHLRDAEKEKTYTIRADNNQIISYYYEAPETTARYIAVTQGASISGGTCTPTMETVKGAYQGSQPIANDGFYFAGWYENYACTEPVSVEGVTLDAGGKLTPKPGKNGTFHALFKPIQLIIRQSGMNAADSAIYQVVDAVDQTKVIATVMLTGDYAVTNSSAPNASVTLEQIPAGNYIVREMKIKNPWTWTYEEVAEQNITVSANLNVQEITFVRTKKTVDWLHGENKG